MTETVEIYKTIIGNKADYDREKDMEMVFVAEMLRETLRSKAQPINGERILRAAPTIAYNIGKCAEEAARINNPRLTVAVIEFFLNVTAVDFGFIQPGTLTMMARYHDGCSLALQDMKETEERPLLDEAQQSTLVILHGVIANIIAGSDNQKFRDLVQRTISAARSQHTTSDIARRLPDAIRLLQRFKPGLVGVGDINAVDTAVETHLSENYYAQPLPHRMPDHAG